jgi:bifunctional UDP-N-acetylglucosamine pyrophosphorylase / glucosamine-1-phosphate N-acetyltransferase
MERMMNIVILAAGKGSRMESDLPKPLLQVGGRPMLDHVFDAALGAHPDATPIVVVGHQHDKVIAALSSRSAMFAHQQEQLGTGHAAKVALAQVDNAQEVLVLFGDVPLLTPQALVALSEAHRLSGHQVTLLSTELADPSGYGRIVRDVRGQVCCIVEEKDASVTEKLITEVNTGIMLIAPALLENFCASMRSENAQGEYYLTDIVGYACEHDLTVGAHVSADPTQFLGANTPAQLQALEALYQQRAVA